MGSAPVKTIKPSVTRVGTGKASHAVVIQAIDDTRTKLNIRVEGVRAAIIRCAVNSIVSVEGVPPAVADVNYRGYQGATTGKRNVARGKYDRPPDVRPARQFTGQDRIGCDVV